MNIKELVNKVKEIKEFKNTKAEYIEVKNKIAEIEAIEEECGKEILKNNIFNMSEESYQLRVKRRPNLDKRILEPNATYHMSEEDLEKYFKMRHEARTQRGVKAKDWETSSTYQLFEEMKQLECKLMNVLLELSPEEIKEDIKKVFLSCKFRSKAFETIINID